ncbi:thioesterase [Methylobacterium sp. GXF4]|jgi:acyl-CoA thioesterase YciA|uniref:Acyl-CoA thioesterase n=1 Tax=Methylobacterium brachiatum TaxID=269660 RepID=A0AAJ1X029_9HYPH|nr:MULTISPECIES: acyl-CoA thioesterase [Methylobacterium]EIZ83761.1 thioesterase [Methylobacterium sp. GXF4]MCB4804942.1 acyl-CoA thioesterase [Methylobacterium brachiatum]MDQ0545983.1 acyl-CoA thioesterase YciA [Methylobacterium brachiatum]SFJ63272.1 acyl-CoA thioesterase YciA [Methylobacterium brachiatum]
MTHEQGRDGGIADGQPTHRGAPVIRTIAMPADTNPAGDIFGGWLMAQMDLAAGNVAARRSRGRCATIAVDAITFHHPVFVGDEVSLYAWLIKVGRSSLRIQVEVWRRERASETTMKVTEATFTFVAIGDDRRPRPVPPEAGGM